MDLPQKSCNKTFARAQSRDVERTNAVFPHSYSLLLVTVYHKYFSLSIDTLFKICCFFVNKKRMPFKTSAFSVICYFE